MEVVDQQQPDFDLRARFCRGLADPSRQRILAVLQRGECTVGEIASELGLSVSNASRHLACLKDCGLVEARQDWRHVHYQLAEGVADLLGHLAVFVETVADRVATCGNPELVESPAPHP